MSNNELLYRVAREALGDDLSIAGLLCDVGTAIESYLQGYADSGEDEAQLARELRESLPHADRLVHDLREASVYAERDAEREPPERQVDDPGPDLRAQQHEAWRQKEGLS